jgi:Resolvase, N terminal domain
MRSSAAAGDVQGAQRELLRVLLDRLTSGDVVTVTRIDRLAHSTFDLFGIVRRIVDAIPFTGRTVGRHRHQQRALDAGGARRLGRRRP